MRFGRQLRRGRRKHGEAPSSATLDSVLAGHMPELHLLANEADRRLQDVNRRLDSAAARGAVIISAAAIASGVQVAQTSTTWTVSSIVASMISAVLALPLVRFSRGAEVAVARLTASLSTWSPNRLELEILNVKMSAVKQSERAMRRRSRLLLFSLVSLAAAIALTAVSVIAT